MTFRETEMNKSAHENLTNIWLHFFGVSSAEMQNSLIIPFSNTVVLTEWYLSVFGDVCDIENKVYITNFDAHPL